MKSVIHHISIISSLLITLSWSQVVYAQGVDSVGFVRNIEIVNIIDAVENNKEAIEQSSSNYDGFSFLQNLDRTTGLTVRSGGPSLLSTIMVRGMASRHIGILWSGFNIQSIVNGTYDASQIPTTFDNVNYLSASSSSIVGNAGVAGAIDLSNKNLGSESKSTFGLNYGTDQNLSLTSINRFQKGNYSQTLGIELRDNENAYDFYSGSQKLTQRNAQYNLGDFNYHGKYKVNEKFHLSGAAWLQKVSRNIPPTKTSVVQLQTQEDRNYRVMLGGLYFLNSESRVIFRSAYFKERLDYKSASIDSRANANIYNFAVDYINDNGFTISPQLRYDFVKATFFNENKSRSTLAILTDYKNEWSEYNYGFSFRPQLIDKKPILGTANLRLSRNVTKTIVANVNLARGYTLPSFNDLYWPEGGNDQLNPETSYNAELGVKYNPNGTDNMSVSTKLFYNDINNWIQWLPLDGLWQPANQRDVRNLGFEIQCYYNVKFSERSSLTASIFYGFVDSRLKNHNFNSLLIGKKTIFVPANKISGTISYKLDEWNMTLMPLYYSKRFDTIDNSSFVAGYFVADFRVSKRFDLKNGNRLQTMISIENTGNNDYESIRFYPMPLRVLRLGIQFEL